MGILALLVFFSWGIGGIGVHMYVYICGTNTSEREREGETRTVGKKEREKRNVMRICRIGRLDALLLPI